MSDKARESDCPDCDGTGNAPNADTDMAICPNCQGSGESPGHNRFDPERVERRRFSEYRQLPENWVRASDYDQLYEVAERMARELESVLGGVVRRPNGIAPGIESIMLPDLSPHLYDRYRAALAAFKGESNE